MLKKDKEKKQRLPKLVNVRFLSLKTQKEISALATRVIEKCIEIEGLNNAKCQVYVTFTTSDEIQKINMKYRNINKETDVLSFPLFEEAEIENILKSESFEDKMLGDIIISLDKAKQQASEYGHTLSRELGFLLTHGFYHLLGYDHMNKTEEKVMIEKQENVLKELKLYR